MTFGRPNQASQGPLYRYFSYQLRVKLMRLRFSSAMGHAHQVPGPTPVCKGSFLTRQ
jgi:hypothetical protein